MSRISNAPRTPAREAALELYLSLTPIQKTFHLMNQFGDFMFVLGDERIAKLEGVDRLQAFSSAAYLLEPTSALEALIMGFTKPWRKIDVLKPYAPELTTKDWERVIKLDWMIPKEKRFPTLSPPAQLLLYRVGAWRNSYVYTSRPTSEAVDVWNTMPEAIRRDPLMHQIAAVRSPRMFHLLVDKDPSFGWDNKALALFMHNNDIPSAQWIRRSSEDTTRMLFPYNAGNKRINRLNPELLHFSDAQLPVIQEVNPALYIQGLIFDRDRREEPQALQWFKPMWDRVLTMVANDAQYADLIINSRTMVDGGVHVEKVLKMFSPHALDALGVSLSLEDNLIDGWKSWLIAQANASVADYGIPLPDLGSTIGPL